MKSGMISSVCKEMVSLTGVGPFCVYNGVLKLKENYTIGILTHIKE